MGHPPPRGSREGRALCLPLQGFSARGSGDPAGEAAPGRERGERGPGAASLPGGHVLSEQAGSAAAALARPRRAGQRPPAARPGLRARPGLVTHLRPGPGPVSAGSRRLRSRRRRRHPRPAGTLRAPQRPCRSGGTAAGGAAITESIRLEDTRDHRAQPVTEQQPPSQLHCVPQSISLKHLQGR